METFDVVIVGGGPAGLSAALTFGRGRAHVLLADGDTPRNARAHEVHNFVTRDGTPPAEFRRIARGQIAAYPSVAIRDTKVTHIERLAVSGESGEAFSVTLADTPNPVLARRILLATGMRDELPAISGLADHWGTSVFQCPYCHGWELRDRPWGVVVTSDMMADFAPMLTNWASTLTAFTNGAELSTAAQESLRARNIAIETSPITQLRGAGALEEIALASGRTFPCTALVFRPPQRPVDLVLALDLARDEQGFVRVDPRTRLSSMPGVHVVGDAITMLQAAIVAASDGMAAAAAMNHELVFERLARNAAHLAKR